MSKSKKNVINPDEILSQYGADAFRMYEMFMGPFEASKPWDMKGIEGISRFLRRVAQWGEKVQLKDEADERKLEILKNKTIVKINEDIENFRFNTAISGLMVLFNEAGKLTQVSKNTFETFLKLLHPFAPHLTEEIWQLRGYEGFLVKSAWPQANAALMQDDTLELGVQINGKVRDRIQVPAKATREETEKLALASAKVQRNLEGLEIKKIIVIAGRMVSIVAAPKK